jgi:hypothetical protein
MKPIFIRSCQLAPCWGTATESYLSNFEDWMLSLRELLGSHLSRQQFLEPFYLLG